MRVGRILFLALFLFSAASILAVGSLAQKITVDRYQPIKLTQEAAEKLQSSISLLAYKKSLLENLQAYDDKKITLAALENNLMEMRVPAIYKDLHLQIAGAVSQLNQNDLSNSESIKSRLVGLESDYTWLARALRIFIANNF